MNDYKLGEIVLLEDTGPTYPCLKLDVIKKYIRLYEPINVKEYYNSYAIESGYHKITDLAKQTDLIWKIKCIITDSLYIISSNKKHMLVCSKYAIKKL